MDKNNNPLTHAKYHMEQVQEARERHLRPPTLDIPQYLQENIKEYLAKVSPLLVWDSRSFEGFYGFFFILDVRDVAVCGHCGSLFMYFFWSDISVLYEKTEWENFCCGTIFFVKCALS